MRTLTIGQKVRRLRGSSQGINNKLIRGALI